MRRGFHPYLHPDLNDAYTRVSVVFTPGCQQLHLLTNIRNIYYINNVFQLFI